MNYRALLRSSGGLRLGTVARSTLAGGDVRVRLLRAAVCGTDLDILRGTRRDRARILGHEGVAEIVERGPLVSGHQLGERVVFNPVNAADQDDILGHSKAGVFQEFRVITEAELSTGLLVPIGAQLDPSLAVLAEPLAAVCYATELCGNPAPREVAIFGGGSIAVMLAWLLSRLGTRRIRLCSRNPASFEAAVARGLLDEAVVSFVAADAGPPEGVDAGFVCTQRESSAAALSAAATAAKDGGIICLVSGVVASGPLRTLVERARRTNVCGTNHDTERVTTWTKAGKTLRLVGHRGTSLAHMQRALELLNGNPALRAMCTTTVPFTALPALLMQLVGHRPRPPLKSCVDFST